MIDPMADIIGVAMTALVLAVYCWAAIQVRKEWRRSKRSAETDKIVEAARANLSQGNDKSHAVERLINDYHEQALGQARIQFFVSISAASLGFVWLLAVSSVL